MGWEGRTSEDGSALRGCKGRWPSGPVSPAPTPRATRGAWCVPTPQEDWVPFCCSVHCHLVSTPSDTAALGLSGTASVENVSVLSAFVPPS